MDYHFESSEEATSTETTTFLPPAPEESKSEDQLISDLFFGGFMPTPMVKKVKKGQGRATTAIQTGVHTTILFNTVKSIICSRNKI